MKALGTYKDFEVSPLDGAFDARTQSGKLNFYDFRLILNMGMSEDRKRCRLGGWRRLLAESPFGFENQDFHDQLAHCQFYYPSYEETIRGGGLVSGFTYPYWFPEMTEYDGYYDVVTPGYPFGEEIPQFENPFSYDRFYCGTERMLRGGCREAITLLYEATSISGQRKLIAGTKSRLAVLNERSGNWRLIGDGLGGPYSVDSNCGCSSRRFKVAQLGNIIVFTNDFDPVLYWSFDSGPEGCNIWSVDYIQELLLLNITRARSAVEWKGFLFVANVEVAGERHPNRIYWSDFNNPLSFFPGGESLAGFQELGLGERILGMQPIGGQLRIYTSKGKEKAIYEVALVGGSEVFNFNEIYHGPDGLEYEYSLVNTGNAHFYLGESGIFVLGEYDRLPQRVEWIHKSDGVIYKGVPGEWVKDFDGLNGFGGINKFACDHAVGGFDSEQKNIWFSWPTDDNECPNMSLIINPIYNHASLVDHGFTAFTMHRPDYTNTVRNWLAEFAGCDPASFLMEKEGVPYEWETPASPPLYIRNETEDPNLPPHPDSLCARLSGITLEDLCEACDAESVFVMASALDKTLKEFTPHLCYRERYRGDTPVYGIGYEPGFPYEFLYEYAYAYEHAYDVPHEEPCAAYFYYAMESVEGAAPGDYITNLASSDSNTNLFLNGGSVTEPPAPGPGVEIVTGFIGNGALSHANHFWSGQVSRTRTQIVDGVLESSYNLLKLGGRNWTARYWIKNASAAPVNSSETDTHMWGVRFFGAAEPGEPDPYQIRVRKRNLDVSGENHYELRMGPFSDPDQLQLFSAAIDAGTVWQNWHRVVITFEASSGTASIQINNDSPVSVSVPGFDFGISSHSLELLSYLGNTAFMNSAIDEFLFLPDVVWDAADSTYDWNSGVGRTWPDVPPHFSCPEPTATGPYYGLAFSSDSDRLCAPRASTGFLSFTNSRNEIWKPEISLLADLEDMRVSGGAAWCSSNNRFYVGLQGHGGNDIDAEGRMNGDELCAVVDPITHAIEYIGGFPVVDSGGSYPSRARKAVYIPTTDRIWLQLFATAHQFAIINPADHSVTFLSDPLLAAIGADLWTYCPVNDSVYCSSSNKVVKIDASTLAVSQVDISSAVPPYPASPGPGDSGWVTVNTGGIDYVPDANSTSGGNVNKVWCVVYGVFRTFGQSDINSGQMVTIDPANADAIGNAGGANAATPNFLWYAPTVHRVLHRAGLNNHPLSAINPDTGAQKNFLPPFYPQLVLPTTYGAFCSSVNKIALPVLADNDLKFLFFSQADLTP